MDKYHDFTLHVAVMFTLLSSAKEIIYVYQAESERVPTQVIEFMSVSQKLSSCRYLIHLFGMVYFLMYYGTMVVVCL